MVVQFLSTESNTTALVEECRSRLMTLCTRPEERVHLEAGLNQLEVYLMQCLPMKPNIQTSDITEIDILSSYSQKWKAYLDRIHSSPNLSANIRKSAHSPGYTGIDIRVRGRGKPDDTIYHQDAFARECVPRGAFFLHLTRHDSRECDVVLPVLRAFPKFSGVEDLTESSPVRTEEVSATTRRFFTQPLETTSTIVATTKANGEAAHLAIYYGLAGKICESM